MAYRIGLDVGIASVGWATLLEDEDGNAYRIGDLGVRIFTKAEHPKDGASLAAPRREARSARRRTRRKKHRKERAKLLFEENGLITIKNFEKTLNSNEKLTDIYELRAKALDEEIDCFDLARVLLHLLQRRGFKSNRKSELKDSDIGKLLSGVQDNAALLSSGKYRSVGEMMFKDPKFSEHKRNKTDDYSMTVSREAVINEATLILQKQQEYLPEIITNLFITKYIDILSSQRSFDMGPGVGSPYAGDQILKMVGACTFEPEELRAAKATYTFEKFETWQKINTVKIRSTLLGNRKLTDEERTDLFEYAKTKERISYSDARKKLKLSDDERFSVLSYGRKETTEVEKAKFLSMKAYNDMRKALDKIEKGYISKLNDDALDNIGYILTAYKSDENVTEHLESLSLSSEVIELLSYLSFSKWGHLSIKAMKKITPFLESGSLYHSACEKAGYDFKGHSFGIPQTKLPPLKNDNLTNPVVRRAIGQTTKVINAIIDKNGSPSSVHIELAREMSKTFNERKDDNKSIEENTKKNEKARQKLIELGIMDPSGFDIVKLKLFEEQNERCIYSGEPLDFMKVFKDPGYVDVDHIIPYSISFDDSYTNKVLVLSAENRQKGNKLPLEYMNGNQNKIDTFKSIVNLLNLPYKKKLNLLKPSLSGEEREEFKERNLNDTKYITSTLYNHIKDNLIFDSGREKNVVAVNGRVTSYMRKRWGLSKVREDGDLHHAMDAVVVAAIDDSIINKVSRYHKNRESLFNKNAEIIDYSTGEIITRNEFDERNMKHFPEPWPHFKREVECRLSNDPSGLIINQGFKTYDHEEKINPVFVSRMPNRKAKGKGHKDTIHSPKMIEEGYTISKTNLTKLKLTKDGEIEGYYNPADDKLLYSALKQQLKKYNGNASKAFSAPFYKSTASGEEGPLVRKVKIREKSNLGVPINGCKGYAANESMVRIDVFLKDSKYYLVPIYIADTVKNDLPNKAATAYKPHEDWREMDDSYLFIFSLYPNDLIFLECKNEQKISGDEATFKSGYMYYIKANISTASITVCAHDNSFEIQGVGIQNLIQFYKCQVDVLGNISNVKREKRQNFK